MSSKAIRRGLAIFGSNGYIGSRYLKSVAGARPLNRRRSLSDQLPDGLWDVFFLGGLTDPKLSRDSLIEANYRFPVDHIRGISQAGERDRFRFFTVGTIHETFESIVQTNPYVASKHQLATELLSQNLDHFHLRLHTAYGGDCAPPNHLFLGQVWRSISTVTPFEMSSGRAIREYHHVDDLTAAFEAIRMRSGSARDSHSRVFNLNHGQSVSLREIATGIFGSLGCESLLKIGAIPDRAGDNWDSHFEPSPEAIYPGARATIPAIIEYFRELLQG